MSPRIVDLCVYEYDGEQPRDAYYRPGPFRQLFLELTADTGARGRWGPLDVAVAQVLLGSIRPFVLGYDLQGAAGLEAVAAYSSRNSRTGASKGAAAALELAVLDLKAAAHGKLVRELIGRPLRGDVAAYVSLLHHDIDSPLAPTTATAAARAGYVGQKWALRRGPGEGRSGMAQTLRSLERLRAALPGWHSLMVDALGKWTMDYATAFLTSARSLDLAWVEEPLGPKDAHLYQRLPTAVAVAAGERAYDLEGLRELAVGDAVRILQPELGRCGVRVFGDAVKLAGARGQQVIPHGASLRAAIEVASVSPPDTVPMVEFHAGLHARREWFLRTSCAPRRGVIPPPSYFGFGFDIDPAKVVARRRYRAEAHGYR